MYPAGTVHLPCWGWMPRRHSSTWSSCSTMHPTWTGGSKVAWGSRVPEALHPLSPRPERCWCRASPRCGDSGSAHGSTRRRCGASGPLRAQESGSRAPRTDCRSGWSWEGRGAGCLRPGGPLQWEACGQAHARPGAAAAGAAGTKIAQERISRRVTAGCGWVRDEVRRCQTLARLSCTPPIHPPQGGAQSRKS